MSELPGGFTKDIVGYCDPLSVRAGEEVGFKISSHTPGPAEAAVVRLICGDDRPHGTGFQEKPIDSAIAGPFAACYQPLIPGSYAAATVDGFAAEIPLPLTVSLLAFPTLLRERVQTLANLGGLELSVSIDGFGLHCGAATLLMPIPMLERRWYRLDLSVDTGNAELRCQRLSIGPAEESREWQLQSSEFIGQPSSTQCYLACSKPGEQHFNGRLQDVCVAGASGDLAHWDFAQEVSSNKIVDVSGHACHGLLFQTPVRAVKGANWDGRAQKMIDAPEQYGAIHFHEDDLTNAGWEDSLRWRIPESIPSGQYALKLTQGESSDYIPFFVRPAVRSKTPRPPVAYLVPTATYLAYANQRLGLSGGIFGAAKIHHANDAYLAGHGEVGLSLYEHHRDRSGVHFSSRLRPILNLKPKSGSWAFNADTHITAWLEAAQQPFDVVTDEDLHREGKDALADYRVVITGTHPEYYSTQMRAGLEEWLAEAGRLMYMGGNGFYWRVAYDPNNPAIIEVRRAEDGTRPWIAEPGEYYHQFTGEYGGLWRRLGEPPNKLVGVGFAAQGFDGGTHYRVQPGAFNSRIAFALEGVEETDIWGDFGNQGGGAAGEEIDRFDMTLGSPAHALVIATSENHQPSMLQTIEEFQATSLTRNQSKVRADMVFFETASGGAVFSTGSISYAGSLCHNDYDNNIARVTLNVLDRFKDSTPFKYPADRP